jgi:hypothetical protein
MGLMMSLIPAAERRKTVATAGGRGIQRLLLGGAAERRKNLSPLRGWE